LKYLRADNQPKAFQNVMKNGLPIIGETRAMFFNFEGCTRGFNLIVNWVIRPNPNPPLA
jgi:hypothetical protein